VTVKAVHICDRCGAEERTVLAKAVPNFWAVQQFQFPNMTGEGHKLLCRECIDILRNWVMYPTLYEIKLNEGDGS
jgi:hypothetical protein